VRPHQVDGPYLITPEGTRLLNFGGNDYLGVVANRLGETSRSTSVAACGAGASALVCGWTPHHEQLATAIATAEGCEAAVIFPSGYAACSGTIATLCGSGDLILSDQLNHASLIDGCRASTAQKIVYPHRDVSFIRDCLSRRRDEFRHVWIVTDGVFSMDGDVAPLRELVAIAETFAAQLIVDEAHGTGVLGCRGSGLCEAVGVQDKIHIRIGTLSKAIGHQGGFVVGPRIVIDYLIQFCRTLIYSTALAPITASGATAMIEQMGDWTDRREHLAALSRHARARLEAELTSRCISFANSSSLEKGIPIVPLIIGPDRDTVALSERLRDRGFFVPAIRPPTVPEGTARLRLSLSAAHRHEHVDALIDAIIDGSLH
jgi:8-amino-7-oxononanoate synthase